MPKDNRLVYEDQPVAIEDNVIRFDGKGNPDTKTLKIYRYRGDITLRDEAIQQFCLENGYEKAVLT